MHRRILLDIGNTNTKWRFEGKSFILPSQEFEFDKLPNSEKIFASIVSQRVFDISIKCVTYVESQKNYKSLINAYHEPKSLGSDRWLAMIACYEFSQNSSFITIDIGTAVTIDLVNHSGNHLGGLIFPGLKKITECFNDFPISPYKNIDNMGISTAEAWTTGTFSLLVNGINQKIRELKANFPDALVFLTGGGYLEIKDFLEFEHIYQENLVLDGLEFFANNMG